MKGLLLFLLQLLACCSIASAEEIQGKVTAYGLFKVSGKEEVVQSPDTPSGVTHIPAGTPILSSPTDRVPAKIGIRFGMWYEIANVPVPDGEVEMTKIVRHPPITKPGGATLTGFTYVEKQSVRGGRVVGWTGYGFDHDYELSPGNWEFEIQFRGKTICKQKFIVFNK